MSVSILNNMMPYGFNDSTDNYRLAYSPQDSDNNIIIGGRDSLWFMSDIHEFKKTKFHHLNSYLDGREHIELGILENSNGLLLQIYENAAESVNSVRILVQLSFIPQQLLILSYFLSITRISRKFHF